MILVKEAQNIILEKLQPLEPENIPLLNTLGAVLQEDICAQRDNPPADNSAMDGYALRFNDISSLDQNNPLSLKVVEDIPAGQKPTKSINPGEASRIMTGAVVPGGADTVVMVEETEKKNGSVSILKPQKKGSHVRKQGEDFKKGDILLSKGDLVTSSNIAIIATAGYAKLSVNRKPVVAILSTGDELVDVDAKAEDHQIINSNTYLLASQVLESGAKPMLLGIVRDRKDDIKEKLKSANKADIIVTSGGVSVGDYDFVKDAIQDLGSEIVFWKIAMKPGKPLTFSMLSKRPLFGLPGNPVSSFVSFEQFVRPAILKMSGHTDIFRKTIRATLTEGIKKKDDGRRHFLRSTLTYINGSYSVSALSGQGSNMLASLASANSLLIIPESETELKSGQQVEVQVLRN
ncbi:MAG: molybdopterin molybdotransferase MoeA [Nitrospinota bacterium]|jgi:molybdopterin molybdotransferase|nr:molybdopterin molybdotransferase MoeA [Nitrospinota bacterium]HJN02549.1 gephyrin-like molybdotransferase Glp [Nitrospinota bacterium]